MRTALLLAIVLLLLFLAAGIYWFPALPKEPGRAQPSGGNPTKTQPAASIGRATMTDDGTIVLDLRAEGPGAVVGDARVVYPRGHKQYDEILRHLGGLRPGERKPVPPWPEKE